MATGIEPLDRNAVSRERFRLFPGWWIYRGATGPERPLYRVMVQDEAELAKARSIKPRCIRAEILVDPTGWSRPRM